MVRIDQTLCGFVKTDGETAQVLVRPCDMDPERPNQNVCPTQVDFEAPEGATTVEISQQPDNVDGAQPPVLIGTAQCIPPD